ncbi:MAG: DUF945 family protein [Rhodoferax sp.]|nr:DUF945 family protein [Rhodoferax sp.]
MALLGVLLAAGALAIPWYSAHQYETQILAWAARSEQGPWRLHKVSHQAGLFSSGGTAELQWRSVCPQDADQEPLSFALAYRISHLPSRGGLSQFSWTLFPKGAAAEAAGLTAGGTVGYDGVLQADMALPALTFGVSSQNIKLAASKGRVRLDGNALHLQWNVADIAYTTRDSLLDLHGARMVLALNDLQRTSGNLALDLDAATAGATSLQGLSLRTEVGELAGGLNYKQGLAVRQMEWMGRTLSDVVLEAGVTGVHAKSAQTLAVLFKDQCGFAALDPEKSALARQTISALLSAGLKIGISKFKARDADSSVDARLELELLPNAHGEVALVRQLQSSGEIVVKGGMLTPEQVQRAIQSGYVQEVPGGLKMGYRYSAGVLTVADQPRDAGVVPLVLARFDQAVNDLLAPESKDPRVLVDDPATRP